MKIELITCLVALISIVPEAGSVGTELGSIWNSDELIVSLDPVPVGEALLVSGDRL